MRNMGICCEASEKGKIVINKCLDNNIEINTIKLEKLLILMHGKMLSMYKKPFFNEDVIATSHGLKIKEVDRDFIRYAVKCNEKIVEYICLLDSETEVMNLVLEKYGKYDVFELNEKKELQVLNKLIYDEKTQNVISNELIERVFDYYQFYDLDIVKKSEESFQKKLRNSYKSKV